MSSRIDDTLRFNQTALNLRAARQELIASNIANADTPNFKAKDIDFASAIKEALAGSASKLAMTTTVAAHQRGEAGTVAAGAALKYRTPTQASADGNTVDMDVERAQFAENALRYEASVQFVSGQVKSILSAIQG